MISFKSFVNAIHDAIIAADEDLKDKNTGLLDKYFIESESDTKLQEDLDNALNASKKITDKGGNVSREDLKNATEAFTKAKKALSGDKENSDKAMTPGTLTPKTVVIEYPKETADGIEYIEVHVPLLTLSPMHMSQIEKAVLKTEFDMEIIDDEVQLNFSKSKNRKGKRNKSRGSLEITLSPQEPSDGLKHVIEGYEKALRTQIP